MRPTKIMPYVVIVDDNGEQITYTFRTEPQARKFYNAVQIGTPYKVGMYVSIKKSKRGKK